MFLYKNSLSEEQKKKKAQEDGATPMATFEAISILASKALPDGKGKGKDQLLKQKVIGQSCQRRKYCTAEGGREKEGRKKRRFCS